MDLILFRLKGFRENQNLQYIYNTYFSEKNDMNEMFTKMWLSKGDQRQEKFWMST
jgi:hypothetical protein